MFDKKTSIVFFGSGDFPYPTFKTILENEIYDVRGLVTSPYKPYIHNETLKDVADKHNIPVYSTHKPNCTELVEWLKEKEADIFCVISYKFLSNEILNIPKITAFNIHASLLPLFKGAAPINWAIRCGMKSTGLTSFVMDNKIDSGEIINNIKIPIEDTDDFEKVYKRLSVLSVGFTIDTIVRITAHKDWRRYLLIQPSFDEIDTDKYDTILKAPKLNKDNTTLPILRSLDSYVLAPFDEKDVYNIIRSLSPNIGCYAVISVWKNPFDDINDDLDYICSPMDSFVKAFNVKIYEAELIRMSLSDLPKEGFLSNVITDGKTYMYIMYDEGYAVSIKTIQIEGKKKLSIKDFLAGFQYARDKNKFLTISGN